MQEVVAQPSGAGERAVSAGPLHGLRVLVTAQTVGLLVAASFAGQAARGGADLAETHVTVAMVVHLIALLQAVAALLVWRPGRGAGWPAPASLGLFLVGVGQHLSRDLPGAHVPGGLTLIGLTAAMLVWVWSPRAALRRS
ncbi:hypothetical protein [Streptosporangium carneum]|uniref:Uncharacterized protein n=1 Tax=Streptosporangium carneum TaxID=47481 RepID=A0A9W6HZ24_9ACTN|nr:hypothetical protein [Streptosporangium carneum]GLK09015.1 hypothetical protein GCM10017600_24210 [Streptosporangium carneum]